jgi:hypothetical protein
MLQYNITIYICLRKEGTWIGETSFRTFSLNNYPAKYYSTMDNASAT